MPPKKHKMPDTASEAGEGRKSVPWAQNPHWLKWGLQFALLDENRAICVGLFGGEAGTSSKSSGNTKTKLAGKLAHTIFDHRDEPPNVRTTYYANRASHIKSLLNYLPK